MALFDGRPRAAAAYAVLDTKVLMLSKDDFNLRVENMDPVISNIVGYMIMRRAAED
jgi:CRP-like cAMP-binding protein